MIGMRVDIAAEWDCGKRHIVELVFAGDQDGARLAAASHPAIANDPEILMLLVEFMADQHCLSREIRVRREDGAWVKARIYTDG